MHWEPDAPASINVNGLRLDARCFGPPPDQAPTLVLLHEGLGSVGLWRDFPRLISEATGLGVFAYSRAGHGYSDPPTAPLPLDFMEREATETLPLVLDAIGFRQGVLLGHSDGASIAALYAARVPDTRIEALVLLAPHFFTEAMGLAEIARAREAFETGDLAMRLARHHENVALMFSGWNNVWLAPGFRDWNITDAIEPITVPVLAIQGRQDQYGTLAQIDALDRLSGELLSTLVLDDCRHAPHLDQTQNVIHAVRVFLTKSGFHVG